MIENIKENKLYYTEWDLRQDVTKIVDDINRLDISYDYITGIPRGGLIPAVALSHALNVPYQAFSIGLVGDMYNKKLLIMDDIIDGGKTLRYIHEYIENSDIEKNVHFSALVYNVSQLIIIPHYYGQAIDRLEEPRWIDFWWEKVY